MSNEKENEYHLKIIKSNRKFEILGTEKGKNALKIIEEGIED